MYMYTMSPNLQNYNGTVQNCQEQLVYLYPKIYMLQLDGYTWSKQFGFINLGVKRLQQKQLKSLMLYKHIHV